MSVQFYPGINDYSGVFRLDVSSFNAQVVFDMFNIQGEGELGTVGSLDEAQILLALDYMNNFVKRYDWVSMGWTQDQMIHYVTKLNLILGFCLGNKCSFNWS